MSSPLVSILINKIRSVKRLARVEFIREGDALTRQIVRRGRTRWLKRNTSNEYLIQAWLRHKSGKVRCKLPPLVVMVFMGHSRLSVEQVATDNCSRQRGHVPTPENRRWRSQPPTGIPRWMGLAAYIQKRCEGGPKCKSPCVNRACGIV